MTRVWNYLGFWVGTPVLVIVLGTWGYFLCLCLYLFIFSCSTAYSADILLMSDFSVWKLLVWWYSQSRTRSPLLWFSTNYLVNFPLTIPFHSFSALVMHEAMLGFCSQDLIFGDAFISLCGFALPFALLDFLLLLSSLHFIETWLFWSNYWYGLRHLQLLEIYFLIYVVSS